MRRWFLSVLLALAVPAAAQDDMASENLEAPSGPGSADSAPAEPDPGGAPVEVVAEPPEPEVPGPAGGEYYSSDDLEGSGSTFAQEEAPQPRKRPAAVSSARKAAAAASAKGKPKAAGAKGKKRAAAGKRTAAKTPAADKAVKASEGLPAIAAKPPVSPLPLTPVVPFNP